MASIKNSHKRYVLMNAKGEYYISPSKARYEIFTTDASYATIYQTLGHAKNARAYATKAYGAKAKFGKLEIFECEITLGNRVEN